MDDKRARILQVFIEEAHEIVDELDILMMRIEEGEDPSSLISEIFRGVHTLKGSANSFGFSRLGEFVHHFEDLLDECRDNIELFDKNTIELSFESITIIGNVLEYEINDINGLPDGYNEALEQIKNKLDLKNGNKTIPSENIKQNKDIEQSEDTEEEKADMNVIVENMTFQDFECNKKELKSLQKDSCEVIKKAIEDNKYLYNIQMIFDDDLYFRGHNQSVLFKLINQAGTIIETMWYYKKVPTLDFLDSEKNIIKKISLYIISDETTDMIEDIFEFTADEHEAKIHCFSKDENDKYFLNIKNEDEDKDEDKIEDSKETEKETETKPKKKDDKKLKKEIQNATKEIKKQASSFIRIESQKVDELFDSVGELVIAQSYIHQNEKIKALGDQEINQNVEALAKSTKLIQSKVMSLRMVAIKDTFFKMKRVARDTAKKTGKEINLVFSGEETEIDKTMIDALSDPLIHMVRNAIDHGLEKNEDREGLGKDKIGQILMSAYHKGGSIVIEIKDDGKGIDSKKIFEKAVQRGLCSEDAILDNKEIFDFLFNAGFSMAKEISDVSGRGVGLDVVKNSIEELKGKVEIDSTLGVGTSFKIILPLTLAIIDGMIVNVGDEIFIIPTLSVVESFRAKKDEINHIQDKGEFFNFRGEILPVLHLDKLMKLDCEQKNFSESTLICLEHEKGKFILRVDGLLGRQQVVVKTLGKFLTFIKEIAGGAILGSGEIALILNIEGIRADIDMEGIE